MPMFMLSYPNMLGYIKFWFCIDSLLCFFA